MEIRVFADKQGREITIDEWDGNQTFIARHNQKEVGKLEFYYTEYNGELGYMFCHIKIDSTYQRSGIGTRLVEYAHGILPNFYIPPLLDNKEERGACWFTNEGMQFVGSLLKKGVLPSHLQRYDYGNDECECD